MLHNSITNNDSRDIFSFEKWIQPSIDESSIPVSNEKIVNEIYSTNADEEVVILTESDQTWFKTEAWQALENEADNDIAEGRFTSHSSMEDFIADLDD